MALTEIFVGVLNMSIAAAVVIAVVLLARVLLRRAPKAFSYALWAVVLFRLLCPVSVGVPVSLFGAIYAPVQENTRLTTAVEYYEPYADPVETAPPLNVPEHGATQPITPEHGLDAVEIAAIVWLCGVAAMLLYGVVSYLKLRRRLVGSVALEGNVRLADGAVTPFVLGLFRPQIYLPSSLTESERGYIVLHERRHIRRLDHVFRVLGFVALSLHWFNPLAWLAFALSGRDMEMSCDEAVLRELGEDVRAPYAESLLRFATGKRAAVFSPTFGESGTGTRIRNLMRWKRPGKWVSVASAALCALTLAACAVNPTAENVPPGEYGSAENIGYYMELAASASGVEFEDMDGQILDQIVSEFSNYTANSFFRLNEGEALLARVSADGRSGYVFWLDEGMDNDFTEVEFTGIIFGVTLLEPGGSAHGNSGNGIDATCLTTPNGTIILIEPNDMGFAGLRGLHGTYCEENGPEYIADAVERGVSLYITGRYYLVAAYANEIIGPITESIELSEAELEAVQSGERVPVTAPMEEFMAMLIVDGEVAELYAAGMGDIPQPALEIIAAYCGDLNITG